MFDDGTILETVYEPKEKRTSFAIWQNGISRVERGFVVDTSRRLVPYSAHNNLIRNEVVLLPSTPEEYHSTDHLIEDIQQYIHRYVDLTPRFEKIASYYVLLSWIYDGFNELPYLRLRGDYRKRKDEISSHCRLALL